MIIIEQDHKILTEISPGGKKELEHIEYCAKLCYLKYGLPEAERDYEMTKQFVRQMIRDQTESVLEHGSLSVLFTTDRGVTHELVRHRLGSYSQQSTRRAIGDELIFVIPHIRTYKDCINDWKEKMKIYENMYYQAIKNGMTKDEARGYLPHYLATSIVVTANYREWRHILKLRTAKGSHIQFRDLMIPLLKELQEKIPVIFDDIKIEEEKNEKSITVSNRGSFRLHPWFLSDGEKEK